MGEGDKWKILQAVGDLWGSIVDFLTLKQWLALLLTVGLLVAVFLPLIIK